MNVSVSRVEVPNKILVVGAQRLAIRLSLNTGDTHDKFSAGKLLDHLRPRTVGWQGMPITATAAAGCLERRTRRPTSRPKQQAL